MADSQSILDRLLQCKVRFVVVGGFAAVAHGSTVVTLDVDICCDFRPPNLLRLQKALSGLHPVHRLTNRHVPLELTAESAAGFKNLYMDTDIGVLDCLGQVLGIGDYQEVRRRSALIRLPSGSGCRVLTIDALIEAKKAMGRPKDLEVVSQLTAILELRRQNRKKRKSQTTHSSGMGEPNG